MSRLVIVAEAGVNHNGNLRIAKKLIDVAKESGADFVKFQSFKAQKIVSKNAVKAAYQKKSIGKSETQFEMLKKLELTKKDHEKLIAYCKKRSIKFLSSPFDTDSILLLKNLGISIGKIPSGEITNLPYLEQMAAAFDQLFVSTGMCDLNEVEAALNVLIRSGAKKEKITVLHCTTEYPTPMEEVNLIAMLTMQKKFGVKVGYSDHTAGIEIPIAAATLGAAVIEKHFTLDRNMKGPDHKASLEPKELKAMITAIRNIEKALGNGIKKPSLSERKNMAIVRKSLVAARNMQAGHILQIDDINIKRPGNGISPMQINEITGKELLKSILEDEVLTPHHFEK